MLNEPFKTYGKLKDTAPAENSTKSMFAPPAVAASPMLNPSLFT